MSERKFARRDVLKGALIGVAAVPVTALLGRAEARGCPGRPERAAGQEPRLRDDASKVDAKANPNFKPGQACANCLQVAKGKETGAEVPCNIFGGRLVSAKGWCKVYVKRP